MYKKHVLWTSIGVCFLVHFKPATRLFLSSGSPRAVVTSRDSSYFTYVIYIKPINELFELAELEFRTPEL